MHSTYPAHSSSLILSYKSWSCSLKDKGRKEGNTCVPWTCVRPTSEPSFRRVEGSSNRRPKNYSRLYQTDINTRRALSFVCDVLSDSTDYKPMESHDRITNKYWNVMWGGRKWSRPNWSTASAWKVLRITMNTSFRTTDFRMKIWTRHLAIITQNWYPLGPDVR
jgi:hypothetical protein